MSAETRIGDWIQTFSGLAFYPFDPRASEVSIVDIAHSLASQCRFGGHCRVPYSVAEHSVRVMQVYMALDPDAHPGLILGALVHDAPEAYILDLPKPIKDDPGLSGYRDVEQAVEAVVAEALGLERAWLSSPRVKAADNIVLATEARDIMRAPPLPWPAMPEPLPGRIEPWGWERAKREFLEAYEALRALERNE